MKPISVYIIVMVFFFPVSLCLSFSFQRFRKRLSSFFREKYSMKPTGIRRSWNTIIDVLWLWATFLFCKKLLYYIPLYGVMQTRFTICWIRYDYSERRLSTRCVAGAGSADNADN